MMNVEQQQFYFEYNTVLKDSVLLKTIVQNFLKHPIENINLFDLYFLRFREHEFDTGDYIFIGLEKENILLFLTFESSINVQKLDLNNDISIFLNIIGMQKDIYQKMLNNKQLYISSVPYEYYKKNHKSYLEFAVNHCNLIFEYLEKKIEIKYEC